MDKFTTACLCILVGILTLTLLKAQEQEDGSRPVTMREFKELQQDFHNFRERYNTWYTPSGEIYREGEDIVEPYSFRRVAGLCKLVAGVDTITLNTTPSGGAAVVGFLAANSYFGYANPVNAGGTASYRVVPLSANKFCIESSDNTDTATVRFIIQGE